MPSTSTTRSIARATTGALVVLVVSLFAACASKHRARDAGDDGGGAPLACDQVSRECEFGLYEGSCGADSGTDPVLACSESSGRCLWFTGGCPEGYRASRCPTTNVCCESTGEGAWPFEVWMGAGMATVESTLDLSALAAPTVMTVTIDPSRETSGSGPICSTGNPLRICTDGLAEIERRPLLWGPSLLVRFPSLGFSREALYLELVAADVFFARLFIRDETDAAPPGAPTACAPPHDEILTAELLLNTTDLTAPHLVHGWLGVTLRDGNTVALEF